MKNEYYIEIEYIIDNLIWVFLKDNYIQGPVNVYEHIKFSVFENIFSRIEKVVITFLILKIFFSKNEN